MVKRIVMGSSVRNFKTIDSDIDDDEDDDSDDLDDDSDDELVNDF